jgi:subtilisin-like proprotein convertase family protein
MNSIFIAFPSARCRVLSMHPRGGTCLRARTVSLWALVALAALACFAPGAPGATFTNATPVTIFASGQASPYAIDVPVTGLRAPTSSAEPGLINFGHTNPDDVDILVVSPSGRTAVPMSDACGGFDTEDATYRFTSLAVGFALTDGGPCPTAMGGFINGANFEGADAFPPPAPPGPYGNSISELGGDNPNGTWKFYVVDDTNPEFGDIENGVRLDIDAFGSSFAELPIAPGSIGNSSPYPLSVSVPAGPANQVLVDVNVKLDRVYHTFPDDLNFLLEGPRGQTAVLMSDACGSADVNRAIWTFDDEAAGTMPNAGPCPDGSYRPTDVDDVADNYPSAPAGPYGTDLSVFDLTDPAGTWRIYAVDEANVDEGFISNPFQVQLTYRQAAPVSFASGATVTEGQTGEVTLQRTTDPPLDAASIRVTSAPASASDGDFPAVDTVVSFGRGETTKTVAVGSADDAVDEADETYSLSLTAPTGDATVGSPASAGVTIVDDDEPGPGGGSVDTRAPETKIDNGPKRKTRKHKAKLKFSADEQATFECSLDSKTNFEPCTSPQKYKGLDDGKHKFFVRATDAAGNVDQTPAKRKWKVR